MDAKRELRPARANGEAVAQLTGRACPEAARRGARSRTIDNGPRNTSSRRLFFFWWHRICGLPKATRRQRAPIRASCECCSTHVVHRDGRCNCRRDARRMLRQRLVSWRRESGCAPLLGPAHLDAPYRSSNAAQLSCAYVPELVRHRSSALPHSARRRQNVLSNVLSDVLCLPS